MTKAIPQYAKVELMFGADAPVIHCPVCGKATMESPDDGFSPCAHVSFIYMGVTGEFEYQSDEFAAKLESADTDNLSFDSFADYLAGMGYNNKTLALEVTYGGMACGPVWYTDVYGFSFASTGEVE